MLNNVLGQSRVTGLLKNVIRSQKIAQSYIFYGPSGVGKLLTAFTFAKALNCPHIASLIDDDISISDCTKECNICKKIDEFAHPDIKYIFPIPNMKVDENGIVGKLKENKRSGTWEPDTERIEYENYITAKRTTPWKDYLFDSVTAIRIEQMRGMQNNMLMHKVEGIKKVYIIDDFDKITTQGANAFLKTLEEPPADTHFILICENKNKLLPTILSRCNSIEFFRLSTDIIENYLVEKLKTSVDKAKLYARLSDGNLANAIRLYHDANLETMEMAMAFLDIVYHADDIAFMDFLEDHFSKKNKQKDSTNTSNAKDTFTNFIKYLTIWLSDLQMYQLDPQKIVFINQLELINKFFQKNIATFDRVHSLLYRLDDLSLKYSGNVNPKLIVTQLYLSFLDRD
jgi:DNA polymerase-3 subunit delta'